MDNGFLIADNKSTTSEELYCLQQRPKRGIAMVLNLSPNIFYNSIYS